MPEGCYKLGTFGDIGTFSLQLNKDITAGEGGMVVTRDKDLNEETKNSKNAVGKPPQSNDQEIQ